MTTNHEHLREVAERATPGFWVSTTSEGEPGHGLCAQVFCQNGPAVATMDHMGMQGTADAKFIATFNPTTAIALLDELAALRKENEGLRAKVDGFNSVLKRYQDARVFTNLHTRQVARSISEDAELDAARLIEERPAQGHLHDMPLSDDELPAMWSNADFTGGDQDERCHAARAAIGDSHE